MAYEQFAYTYDRLMADMPYDSWIAWFEQSCLSKGLNPRTVVDLGCGTGTIAIPLASKGYKVFGVDLSEDMLAVAQDKSQGAKLPASGSVTWLQGDLRDWVLPEKVDVAISLCDCMNYVLDEEGIIAAIQSVYDGLVDGGLFLFDVHTPQLLRNYAAEQPYVLDEEEIAYTWVCELDEEEMTIHHQLSIFSQEPSGLYRRTDEEHVQRAYELDWLSEQLRAVGFTNIEVTADFTTDAPNKATSRAFFSAQK
ncbi:class I SAM-dependent methyltransferase [Paenibacillus sp. N1-5-1-14]|uniref:class I SAM-dependent DNA methyltransferase n=1 Tax=Paenibacillus radicibacter TaxID=2972488 RepID=UPI0021597D86|nr:class I SAM-dependent methyltransferase [Paenibacillus radicibacter]MCR8645729.1 class I SAM-dependent methyltransferase [Paenibacillus radicibacter]